MDKHPHEFVHDDHKVSEVSKKAGYEVTDLQANLAVYTFIGLFALLFGVGVIFSIFYLTFMQNNVTPPLAVQPVQMMVQKDKAPENFPKLQQNPEHDKEVHIGAENALLNSYGKLSVEAEDGSGQKVVRTHIPIDRAIELLATGKIPYRQTPKVALDGAAQTGTVSVGGI